jgi:hypothetical protein
MENATRAPRRDGFAVADRRAMQFSELRYQREADAQTARLPLSLPERLEQFCRLHRKAWAFILDRHSDDAVQNINAHDDGRALR